APDTSSSSGSKTPAGGTGGKSPSGSSGSTSTTSSSSSTQQGNPFGEVNALTDGSVQGLTQEVLVRNGIDPAVEFDVKSDFYGVRIQGATQRTQRDELYVVQRVKTEGFRFLLHQERIDRLLPSSDDLTASTGQ